MRKARKTTRTSSSRSAQPFEVEVAVLGGELKIVELEKDETVADALEKADLTFDESTVVKCGGRQFELEDMPAKGDRLILSNKSKGAEVE